jgi:hypothetical protein
MILEKVSCSTKANRCTSSPTQLTTLIGEQSVGLLSIGDKNALIGIGLYYACIKDD